MPCPQADHSREFKLASGSGKVRLQMNPQAAAEGQAGVMEHIAKTGEQGGGCGVRRGDDAAQGYVFKLCMMHEIPHCMQRRAEQFRIVQEGQGRALFAVCFFQRTPQGKAAIKDGRAAAQLHPGMAAPDDGKLHGNICEIKTDAGQRCKRYNHKSTPSCKLLQNCKDIFSKLTRIIHFYYGADVL